MKPTWSKNGVDLYLGDCREILPQLPKVDAVVTDPPYGVNTKSDGMGKLSPWADLCNSSYWYQFWIGECRRLLRPTGCLWSFLNWRSLVTFQKAACDLAWPIESLLVWDKKWIGPGGSRGLRPSYELCALWCRELFSIEDRGLADIQAWPWSAHKPNGHPAEKPEDALLWILSNSTKTNSAIVLDPFMGSGTTGYAAVRLNRKFIGIEIEPKYFDIAVRRIEAAMDETSLIDYAIEQEQQLELAQ